MTANKMPPNPAPSYQSDQPARANKMPEAVAWMHRGDLETMKEFPDAVLYALGRDLGGQHAPLYTADQMRAMYLAGIAAARGELPVRLHGENEWAEGFNACRDTTLANLTALEQEAKK